MSGPCRHYIGSDRFGRGPITQCPGCSGYSAQITGERETKHHQTIRQWTCRNCDRKFITIANGPLYEKETT